jgi:hypothetical protein
MADLSFMLGQTVSRTFMALIIMAFIAWWVRDSNRITLHDENCHKCHEEITGYQEILQYTWGDFLRIFFNSLNN